MIQDVLAKFDDKRLASTAADATHAGPLNVGTVLCDRSYDTAAAGVPNAATAFPGSGGGAIGGTLLHDIGRGRKVRLWQQVLTTLVGATATLAVDFITAD